MLSLNSHVFMGHPVHKIYIKYSHVYGTPCAQNLHKMFCPTLNKHLVSWIIIQTMVDDFNVVTQLPFFLGHPVSQNA